MNPVLKLAISTEEYNEEEIGELLISLKNHIKKSEDVENVDFADLPPTEGTKGPNIDVLSLLVTLAGTNAFEYLLKWITTWPKKDKDTHFKMTFGDKEIEWSGSLEDEEFQKTLSWFKTQTQYNWTG